MAEPISNLYVPCREHEHKPGVFIGQPRERFLGKTVKLGFKIKRSTDREHMWVKVLGLGVDDDEEIIGELVNEPVRSVTYEYGDHLAFKVKEIEDVLYLASGPADPVEKEGVKMIVYLQKYFSDVDEPEDRALDGWRNMSREERIRVGETYKMFKK